MTRSEYIRGRSYTPDFWEKERVRKIIHETRKKLRPNMNIHDKTITHRLYGEDSWSNARKTILAAVFKHMYRLSKPVLQHFEGDLFHDALWLHANVTGPGVIFYGFNNSGTAIDFDLRSVAIQGRDYIYRLDLRYTFGFGETEYHDDARCTWFLDVTELDRIDIMELTK